DCEYAGYGVVLGSTETSAFVLDGITVENGQGSVGGGIICASSNATVQNCIIHDCFTPGTNAGAGFKIAGGAPRIVNCVIRDNIGVLKAGGVRCYSSTTPVIINCTITGNISHGPGGGVYCEGSSTPTFVNCIIRENSADQGNEIAVVSGNAS